MRYIVANMGPYLEGEVEIPEVHVRPNGEDALAYARQLLRFHYDKVGLDEISVDNWDGDGWMTKEGSRGVALAFDSGSRDTYLVTDDGGEIRSDGDLFRLNTTGLPGGYSGPLDASLITQE